jgi:RNA polymerase sigma-54 factor
MHIQAQAMDLIPQLAMRPSKMLVAAMELLAVSSLELERMVDRELASNPALEQSQQPACPRCGLQLRGARCDICARLHRDRMEPAPLESTLAGEPSLAETLTTEVRLQVSPGDWPIAEYLLGCLDEHGFIDAEIDDVAAVLDVERERAEAVLGIIQASGPPGVGARGVRECLLLQLDRLAGAVPHRELVRMIIATHLPALARGRYGSIARGTGADRADVIAARDMIRARLRPYPTLSTPSASSGAPLAAAPEIVVREQEGVRGGFAVELLEPRRLGLGISASYERLGEQRLTGGERAEAEAQAARARSFLHRLDRRWATIQAVAQYVVERQRRFLVHGPSAMTPLTRRQVGEALGFHESTVSRAVRGRRALLPSRRVVPLEIFFDAAAGPRDALARVVAAERRAMSDSELADELTRAGFPMARRTVAKYRGQLGIPSQPLR